MSIATFAPSYLLSVGDGFTVDTISLLNLGPGTKTFIQYQTFRWSGGKGSGTLIIQGDDARWTQRAYDDLKRLFRHGSQAASPSGHGVRATLTCQLTTDQALYLDVVDGDLAEAPEWADGRTLVCPFTFTTLPYARGEPIIDTATATLTNGVSSVVYRDLIPGTAPALVRVELIDSSTGTLVINRARIGVWSDRYLYSAAGFPAAIDGVARSPGTDSAGGQANTVGGKYTRITTTSDWQDIADFAVTVRGLFALVVRVRDSATATASTVTIKSANNAYLVGSLPNGGYTYKVAALDAGGKVLAVSKPFVRFAAAENGGSHRTTLTWTAVAGAADHRVYWKRDFQNWLYLATGSSSASYLHTTESGATTANPPNQADAALVNAQVRAVVRMPAGAATRTYPPLSCQLSNGTWEHVIPLVEALPPIVRGESTLADSCIVTIQGKSGGTNTPTLDVDAAFLLTRMPGSYAEAWFRTGDLATKRTLVFDPDRSGYSRSYLTDGSGNYTNPIDCTPDALQVEPGGALFNIVLEAAGGISDVLDLKCQVKLTIIPRYSSTSGLPWL